MALTEATVASARDLDLRVQPDIQTLASLLRSWTKIDHKILSCNWVSLVYFIGCRDKCLFLMSVACRYCFLMHSLATTSCSQSTNMPVKYLFWTNFFRPYPRRDMH